ncbi:hypothetical protein [Gillisia limnaea]|uniref:MlpB protein n=1 Tax=Gillisia limnaea (strain DSM 15749 / LMG 21470 / R-8282) TaxID=865937 RepID=H2BZF9_GILLR|nr:hypothetical protein [Gillisia limnaea]EHQ02322.1 hypothetical protein Gilli_1675 [Gillisia limnaea DSM 15749]
MKNRIKKLSVVLVLSIAFVGCKNTQEEDKETITLQETIDTPKEKEVLASNYQLGDHIPNELVCMVNNAYMGTTQIPVPVDGKTYYGCCEMCVGKLNNDENARMGKDPFSGKMIDKSQAYIILSSKDGAVAYFETEDSYKKYKNQMEKGQ